MLKIFLAGSNFRLSEVFIGTSYAKFLLAEGIFSIYFFIGTFYAKFIYLYTHSETVSNSVNTWS